MRPLAILCLCLCLFQSCLKKEPLKLEPHFTPKILADDWEINSPESEGFDKAKLAKAYDLFFSEEEGFRTAISLLVIKNGSIVAEAYCRNEDDYKRLNNLKSATKSVTSILFGQAMQDGFIDTDISKTLGDYFPSYSTQYPDKADIDLYHLLTMQSGIDYNNQENTGVLLVDKPASSLDYIFSIPIAFKQGSYFDYHDGNSHLLGAIIQKQTGKTLAAYANEKLFTDLNISEYEWEIHPDSLNYGAFGLYLKPRDFAKFGQLILNEGKWQGKQLINESWIINCTSPYTNVHDEPYGFQWWIRPAFNAFSSAGHGGQYTYIIPEKDLLIVYTAEPTVITHEYGTDFKDFEKIVALVLEALE